MLAETYALAKRGLLLPHTPAGHAVSIHFLRCAGINVCVSAYVLVYMQKKFLRACVCVAHLNIGLVECICFTPSITSSTRPPSDARKRLPQLLVFCECAFCLLICCYSCIVINCALFSILFSLSLYFIRTGGLSTGDRISRKHR